jgi:hypothetical protein
VTEKKARFTVVVPRAQMLNGSALELHPARSITPLAAVVDSDSRWLKLRSGACRL